MRSIIWTLTGLIFLLAVAPSANAQVNQVTFDGERLHVPLLRVDTDYYSVELILENAITGLFRVDQSSIENLNATVYPDTSTAFFESGTLYFPRIQVGEDFFALEMSISDPVEFLLLVDFTSLVDLTESSFKLDSHIVSTSFFHWFASNGGQLSGPWIPLEGRENWDGFPAWWQTQIKQVMAANIDVMNVHLIPSTEERRITLFQGYYQLRQQGFDVPKIAPFLDPLITWHEQPLVDLATQEGKDDIANQYIRFYNQYLEHNPDPAAIQYLAKIDGRPILVTWHAFVNFTNISSLEREDIGSRLNAALGDVHTLFQQPPYMITTALNDPVFKFADERIAQFEINEYYFEVDYNELSTAQIKPGYWDQNVRTPGDFLPRDGGIHYIDAWEQVHSEIDRVYVESFNEYDEGTGIYAGSTEEPYILPGSDNLNTDTWSVNDDPFEYIQTTARGASEFNDTPQLDAVVLTHDLPDSVEANQTVNASITIRNAGDESWTGAAGFKLAQFSNDSVQFLQSDLTLDDNDNEIPLYGGIFRGRPVIFEFELNSPTSPGEYLTHWQMMKGDEPFGQIIEQVITVTGSNR